MDRWQQAQNDIGVFTDKTFGQSTFLSKMTHLKEEIQELLDAPEDESEWADCLILFLDAARCTNMDMDRLYNAVQSKMVINKARKWGAPNEDGIVHHIEPIVSE